MGQPGRRWTFGWCEYIEISRTLLVRGERSALRGKPLDVLFVLLTHPDTVVPKETLLRTVWQNTSYQSLTVAISKLRRAFGGELDDLIQNVASEGYRMAVPVFCEVAEEPASPAMTIEAGDRLPQHASWVAVSRLGGPDHGPVWLGRNESTGEQRVFKFATDGVRLRALQRELTVAGILRRSGLPAASLRRMDDWDFKANPYYTATEYVGPSLQLFGETDEFAGLGRADRVALVALLANGVAAAHAMGILHNDLKPSNVLIRRLAGRGEGETGSMAARYAAVLIDFGDSSLLRPEVATEDGAIPEAEDVFSQPGDGSGTVGSEMYRAPEIRRGGVGTVEADVYSLGVMLYQAVVGDFQQVPSAGWQQDISDPLLEADIARAAHREAHRRFRTAAELAGALNSLEERRRRMQEQAQAQARMLEVQREVDRARAARPWIAAAMAALTLGVVISAWFYRAAVRERNTARRENVSLESMLRFLSEDILDQSNPSSGVPGSNRAVDLTLARAILNAEPQIDRRFPHAPMVAGKLHETIADGLRSRTQLVEADEQYGLAAQEYRSAEGPLSQAAIAVELKRDASRMVGLLPGAMAEARRSFDQQVALIRQLPSPEPEVLVLQDFVESGLLGMETDPAKAIPPLQRAIQRAQATPGFDPMLLLWIKGRFCGLYVRLQDGPRLQAAAAERIQDISGRFGKDSPMLTSYEMYLQEAYFLEGKYQQAIEQADRNYPRFQRLLGDQHQYTLAVLANRASSLAQLGRYADAMQDDLRLYTLAGTDPSGFRLKEGSLNDAALFACRSGKYREGLEYARRVLHDTAPGANSMPGYFNGSKFIEAECMVGEEESAGKSSAPMLATVNALLKEVDSNVIRQQTGDTGYGAFVELTAARAAWLAHDREKAARHVAKVDAFFAQPDGDPYELQHYRELKDELKHAGLAG